jgi:hypothetical protein
MITRRTAFAAPYLMAPAVARAENASIDVNSFLRDAATRPGGRELQMALAASAKFGAPAHIPSGCTVILRNEPSVVLPSGATLTGQGRTSVIAGAYTRKMANCLLQNDWKVPVHNLSLRNFAIDRSGSGVEHGILLNGVNGLTIDGLHAFGASAAISGILGISSILNATSNVSRIVSRNVVISNSEFNDCGNFGIQLGAVDRVIVRDCRFLRAYREAVGVEPEACDTASSINILRNYFACLPNLNEGSQTGVIVVTMTSGGSLIRRVYIAKNTIDFGTTQQGKVMPGIGLYGSVDAVVEKNIIKNAAGPGIQLGNLFEKPNPCGPLGGLISGRLVGARVLDNQIDSPNMGRNVGGMGAAIYARGARNTLIAGNRITGNFHTSKLVQDSGARGNSVN